MEKNFYNYFNCNDKEELYSLIKDQDESVKELVDYIEYAKENILERNYKITNQSQLEEAFRMGDIINPGSDEISIIFLDSSNNIINNKVFNNETSLEDIMLESYSPVAKSFILINGENGTRKALQLGDDLNTIGFTEIDILSKEKDNIFFSKLGGESKEFGEPQKRETPYNFSKEINKLEKMTNDGYDEVEFFISTNVGQDLKPLNKIASGGEVSRVMLALKVIFSKVDNIPILIFDEIDTGIGGETVRKIALKLKEIGENTQIISITHSPVIASKASQQFYIEKYVENSKTISRVKKLSAEERIKEIGRMLVGEKINNEVLEIANKMLNEG